MSYEYTVTLTIVRKIVILAGSDREAERARDRIYNANKATLDKADTIKAEVTSRKELGL